MQKLDFISISEGDSKKAVIYAIKLLNSFTKPFLKPEYAKNPKNNLKSVILFLSN